MCVMCNTEDLHEIVALAREAADDVLATYLRIPVSKGLGIGTPQGFTRIVARLAAELRRRAAEPEEQAVKNAMAILDVDWAKLTPARRSELVSEAVRVANRGGAAAAQEIRLVLGRAADQVVRATRSDERTRHHLVIAADFNAVDRRMVRHIVTAHTNFVRDEYGRRHDALGIEARRIVAQGLEQGLGRDDIAADLEKAASAAMIGKAPGYWEVVASAFAGEGRSFAQVSAFAEAGIERYVLSAILDERTTDLCRFMDGKEFAVGNALLAFDRQAGLEEPEAIKQLRPWVRERLNEETGARELGVKRGEGWTRIAVIERSGVGVRDGRGSFSQALGNAQLAGLGIFAPPFHGHCRSVLLPA